MNSRTGLNPTVEQLLIERGRDFILSIDESQLRNLQTEGVCQYIINGELTLDEAIHLTDNQRESIHLIAENPELQQILKDNNRGLNFILSLDYQDKLNLRSNEVRQYIISGEFTLDQAIHLTADQKAAFHLMLESEEVRQILRDNQKGLAFMLSLDSPQRQNLRSIAVRRYITSGELTLDDAMHLNYDQLAAINLVAENLELQQVIRDNNKGLDFILSLNLSQRKNLRSKEVCHYLTNGELALDDAIHLTDDQKYALRQVMNSPTQQQILRDNNKGIDFILSLSPSQQDNLASREVCQYILNGQLTLDQAINFTYDQSKAFHMFVKDCELRLILLKNEKGMDFVLSLNAKQLLNFEFEETRKYLINGKLTLDETTHLTVDQKDLILSPGEAAKSPELKRILTENNKDADFIRSLSLSQRLNLGVREVLEYIINGELTLDEAIHLTHDHRVAILNGEHIEIPRLRRENWETFINGFSQDESLIKKLNNNKLFDRNLIKAMREMIDPDSPEPHLQKLGKY